jgi:hypothetical protein
VHGPGKARRDRRRLDAKLRIALFGGSGATGRRVIGAAAARGWHVTGLTRKKGALPSDTNNVTEIVGEFSMRDAVVRTVSGADAAISAQLQSRSPANAALAMFPGGAAAETARPTVDNKSSFTRAEDILQGVHHIFLDSGETHVKSMSASSPLCPCPLSARPLAALFPPTSRAAG